MVMEDMTERAHHHGTSSKLKHGRWDECAHDLGEPGDKLPCQYGQESGMDQNKARPTFGICEAAPSVVGKVEV